MRNSPRCSSSRARQVTSTELPGWSTGCMVRERPPRTMPRCRPRPRVITSAITDVSPWRRTPSTMASSLHCMAKALRPRPARSKPVVSNEILLLGGDDTLHLARVVALTQVDAVFQIGLHAGEHLRPALAIHVGGFLAALVFPPAGLGDGH